LNRTLAPLATFLRTFLGSSSEARGLNPVERDSERITQILRKQAESHNFKGIEFPMSLKDIDKFERLNPEIKANVFGYEAECVYPLRISKLKRE